MRITVQLIDGRRDTHLWAESYERDFKGALALQREIAREVASRIQVELGPEQEQLLADTRPVDPEALDAYLRGLQLEGSSSRPGAWGPRAVEQFERAVELDPDFAEAWMHLAAVRVALFQGPEAREAATRALEIDDRLGGAHAMLGFLRRHYDWDFAGADRAFERAAQLSPNDPLVLEGYVWSLLWRGRPQRHSGSLSVSCAWFRSNASGEKLESRT